jgi:alcohol dehydrogenase
VSRIVPGQRVLVSCISSCGSCRFCRAGCYSQCIGGGGWILGHRIDGTQAEYVRAPFADTSLHQLAPSMSDETTVLLADIGPTAYEVGVRNGQVSPGDVVAIVGAGPIGLAAVKTAQLYSPSHLIVVDPLAIRLDAAKRFGADLVAQTPAEAREFAAGLTEGLGVDVAIEAVGIPETFELCTELVRPGGRIANVGVHGKPVVLHLEDLWARNITITTGLVDTATAPALLNLVANGRLRLDDMVTHRFGLDEMLSAYDVFAQAAETGALKVALFRTA